MAISLKKIIGTITGKVAFERTGENFDTLENSFNALETTVETKASNADLAAHKAENVQQLNLKANKQQENWITGTLKNGWQGTIQYRKNEIGQLELRGAPFGGTGAQNTVIFTLPINYRPNGFINVGAGSNGTALSQLTFDSVAGDVFIRGGIDPGQLYFDGLVIPI